MTSDPVVGAGASDKRWISARVCSERWSSWVRAWFRRGERSARAVSYCFSASCRAATLCRGVKEVSLARGSHLTSWVTGECCFDHGDVRHRGGARTTMQSGEKRAGVLLSTCVRRRERVSFPHLASLPRLRSVPPTPPRAGRDREPDSGNEQVESATHLLLDLAPEARESADEAGDFIIESASLCGRRLASASTRRTGARRCCAVSVLSCSCCTGGCSSGWSRVGRGRG